MTAQLTREISISPSRMLAFIAEKVAARTYIEGHKIISCHALCTYVMKAAVVSIISILKTVLHETFLNKSGFFKFVEENKRNFPRLIWLVIPAHATVTVQSFLDADRPA